MSTDPLRVRDGGTWTTVGTATQPVRLRLPDGTWRLYGGGTGVPLREKQPDGSWRVVATEGVGGPVVVPATSYTFIPDRFYLDPGDGTYRDGYAHAAADGSDDRLSTVLATFAGGVDFERFQMGTAFARSHHSTTAKQMTHAYVDLSEFADDNHLAVPYVPLPPGVVFPYNTWTHLSVHLGGAATYLYTHNRAAGLSVTDIRDPATIAAWDGLQHTLRRVDPATIPTTTVAGAGGHDFTAATPLYHEPAGTILLAVSAAAGPQSADVTIARADLDGDVFAFAVMSSNCPADPPTDDANSNGITNWEAYTMDGGARFTLEITLYWPSWTYHT
jgi:hypothetical protein